MAPIASARQAADAIPDRNRKAAEKAKVSALQKQVDALMKPKVDRLDKWLIDGIQLWINTFMPTLTSSCTRQPRDECAVACEPRSLACAGSVEGTIS